jgi:hypothetical protein
LGLHLLGGDEVEVLEAHRVDAQALALGHHVAQDVGVVLGDGAVQQDAGAAAARQKLASGLDELGVAARPLGDRVVDRLRAV